MSLPSACRSGMLTVIFPALKLGPCSYPLVSLEEIISAFLESVSPKIQFWTSGKGRVFTVGQNEVRTAQTRVLSPGDDEKR